MHKKTTYISLLLLLLFLPTGILAQTTIGDIDPPSSEEHPVLSQQPRGTNMISCSEYEAITYNGYTISQIEATDGEASQVKQLWGNYDSVETDNILGSNTYYFGSNYAHFYDGEVTRIEIKSSNWTLAVKGKNINVGDTFSELQQKFGNDLKIIHKPDIDSNYAVSFSCQNIDSKGLLIDLSPETNKVVKIIYFVST